MQELGILLSLVLLIYFAYRGFSVIYIAPIIAILAALSQGISPMPGYTELFLGKAVGYFKSYFPVFILGAIIGKVFEDTGMAESVARAIIKAMGKGKFKAIIAVSVAGMVLTYGGVNALVAVFAVYPFASALFREMDIPKRLLPAVILVGIGTLSLDAIPGTPQVANIMPTKYFGTDLFAAPITGIVAGLLIVGLCFLWFKYQLKKAEDAGEGYGDNHTNEPDLSDTKKPIDWRLAVLPLIIILLVNLLLTKLYHWDPNILAPFQAMNLPLIAPSVSNIAAIWSLIIAEVIGIIVAIIIGWKNFHTISNLQKTLNAGAIGSLVAVMNVVSEVGYGNVIASLPGFKSISNFLMGIQIGDSPLLSVAVTVNVLAGITGSASGGLAIALEIMGKHWLDMANAIGMSPEILHRIAALAAGGMDDLPHNGAIITILLICGLTHKQAYKDMFAVVVAKTFVAFFMVGFFSLTGLL